MIALLVRLAFGGIRTRLLASMLTIAIAGAAATTIVLALEVRATGDDPWARTFAAAHMMVAALDADLVRGARPVSRKAAEKALEKAQAGWVSGDG